MKSVRHRRRRRHQTRRGGKKPGNLKRKPPCSPHQERNVLSLKITPEIIGELECLRAYQKLQRLKCDNMELTRLPLLPDTITWLTCSNNLLTELPPLPPLLEWLECNNNQLTEIASLPSTVEHFDCSNNQLMELPLLPKWFLRRLNCANNPLTEIRQVLSDINFDRDIYDGKDLDKIRKYQDDTAGYVLK